MLYARKELWFAYELERKALTFARFANANLRTQLAKANGNKKHLRLRELGVRLYSLAGTQKTVSHDIMTMSKKRPRKRL